MQAQNISVCESPIATLWLWNELKKNTPESADAGVLVGKTPLPDDPLAKQITPFLVRAILNRLNLFSRASFPRAL